MLNKIMSNPVIFYSIFAVICIIFLIILAVIINKIKNKSERKKLKKTSDIILTEHFEEPQVTTLEEEISALEEKAKQNETPIVENIEIDNNKKAEIPNFKPDTNEFIKNEPIQIEITSDVTENSSKCDIGSVLSKMQEDLTKKDEHKIETFEQEQEESAIISYQELLKANNKEKVIDDEDDKFDFNNIFVTEEKLPKHSEIFNKLEAAEDLSIISIDEIKEPSLEQKPFNLHQELMEFKQNINKKDENTRIEIDDTKEPNGKFKMSEFISPIYGRMEGKFDYPTIPNIAKIADPNKNISDMKNDEFLNALKAFRQNL